MNNITEFEAFSTIHNALEPLDDDTRSRVMNAVATLLGVGSFSKPIEKGPAGIMHEEVVADAGELPIPFSEGFTEFAELFAATDPGNNSEKALVAGYWLQKIKGANDFSAHYVNKELNNLGHKISHTPSAFAPLVVSKPQLILQLRKSSNSPQARKVYKLSMAGIKAVEDMVRD